MIAKFAGGLCFDFNPHDSNMYERDSVSLSVSLQLINSNALNPVSTTDSNRLIASNRLRL